MFSKINIFLLFFDIFFTRAFLVFFQFRDGDDPSLPADWTSHDTRAVLKISVTEQKLTVSIS